MTNTTTSIEIPVSPDQLWQLIGGFDSLTDWLPFVATSETGEGGRVRTLGLAQGGTVIERLEAFDQKQRTYTYSIIQAPFPVVDYESTLTVHATDQENVSRVEWSGRFTPVNVSDDEAKALFHKIYSDGLEELEKRFSA